MYTVTQATRALALWLAAGTITQAQYCTAMAKLAALPDNAEVTL